MNNFVSKNYYFGKKNAYTINKMFKKKQCIFKELVLLKECKNSKQNIIRIKIF